MPPEFYESV